MTDEIQIDVKGGTGRNASTLELFFDLVYVFAITQVVSLIHEPTPASLGKGAFLLLLLWWTWSIYTWTTNWSGTSSGPVKLFLLGAMGATLLMALAVPGAFDADARLFGLTYFLVRMLAAGLYWVASRGYAEQRAAFLTFFPLSFTASLLVFIGGFLGPVPRTALWIGGALFDMISAGAAGRGTWALDARHFAERNALFVIIALGESVVGVGLAAADVPRDWAHLSALAVAFVGIAVLWWAYFDRAAPYAEAYLTRVTGKERGRFARDAYSILHFPLVVGIVFYAVALEVMVIDPTARMSLAVRMTMSAGAALVFLSIVAGTYRAIRRVPAERLVAGIAVVTLAWIGTPMPGRFFAASVVLIVLTGLLMEARHPWPQPRVDHRG